jgi:hypothetical protein
MEIKEFIQECISSIVEAAISLQEKHANQGAIINPPAGPSNTETFVAGSSTYRHRRVQNIEFDLALTTSSSTEGGGKGGVRIFGADINAAASHARNHEQISRVKFSIPVSLPESDQGEANRKIGSGQTNYHVGPY